MKTGDLKIQSISDVITNSSSEIFIVKFVIDTTDEEREEIRNSINEGLEGLCKVDGLDAGEVYEEPYIAENHVHDGFYNYNINEGDVVIETAGDNSMPYWMMEWLSEYAYKKDEHNVIDRIDRRHLG